MTTPVFNPKRHVPRIFLNEKQRQEIRILYQKYGTDYEKIAKIMGMKTRKVRDHILSNIASVTTKEFSSYEDSVLLDCVETLGTKWSVIAHKLGTKSAMHCRNRFRTLSKQIDLSKKNYSFQLQSLYLNARRSNIKYSEKTTVPTVLKPSNMMLQPQIKQISPPPREIDMNFNDRLSPMIGESVGPIIICNCFSKNVGSSIKPNEPQNIPADDSFSHIIVPTKPKVL